MAHRTLAALSVLALAGAASADWNPGDPYKMHYPQLPDLSPNGMDVYNDFYPWRGLPEYKWLADDFMCTETGPILDVHFWGSWLHDQMPPPDPTDPGRGSHGTYEIAIYSDVPAIPGFHSHPGQLLWNATFTNGTYRQRRYAEGPELFYDPNQDAIIGTDTQVWQYNFDIPAAAAYYQTAGEIYWLAVLHHDSNGDGFDDPTDLSYGTYGWKTSYNHFNDDAVFGDFGSQPFPGPWGIEMRYPPNHPYYPQSIDLSFVITPTPGSAALLAVAGLVGLRRRR